MKKTLSVLGLAICGLLFSQDVPFSKLYSYGDPVNYYLGSYPVTGSAGLDINWYGGVRLRTSTGVGLQLLENGNVGIGTSTPTAKFDVNFGNEPKSIRFFQPSTTLNPVDTLISSLMFTWYNNHADIGIIRGGGDNIIGLGFRFNGEEKVRFTPDGNVGIGTYAPAYKLDVVGNAQFQDIISGGSNSWIFHTPDDGRKSIHLSPKNAANTDWDWGKGLIINGENGNALIHGKFEAKEVKVTQTPTADFVFENEYDLPKLEDVEKFIKEKKHLPEIASAKVMDKDGVNIGEFQIKLLQKIEELTLYSIEQNKQIKSLQEENKTLKSQSEKIDKLEKKLEQMLAEKK
ncbi:ELKS/Rab6-interacting/CAST family protein [Chryseobacterium oranimense]|uniref:ELKS/Rab6-interacting/CAST family protein n=1 Tax=Chryseobacterium oranimense TaxID=421058 RepID=UPI0021AE6FC2|nr:ELKS/Rab6-interacting/CAST family protein [Chryseobacterium oranimense]UWX60936.1 ELKS/Rab6-interacting/CAST family protein [Chryseobacterium oranimense]